MSSYAVLWSEPSREIEVGKLELDQLGLRFEGSRAMLPSRVHRVYYEDIHGVRIGHTPAERLGGRPALVLDLAVGGPLLIGSVGGIGAVGDLADQLSRRSAT